MKYLPLVWAGLWRTPIPRPVLSGTEETVGSADGKFLFHYTKSGADASGRPLEQPAASGARFYDGTAFSFSNTTSPTQDQQTFLYTLDSTPAMDYLLP